MLSLKHRYPGLVIVPQYKICWKFTVFVWGKVYVVLLPGLTVNELVAHATGFLVVHLKIHGWSHLCAIKPKAQCDWLASDHTYVLEWIRRLTLASSNENKSNVEIAQPSIVFLSSFLCLIHLFSQSFNDLLHPRLFCFVINAADTCKYATSKTPAFCAMDNHVERSVLRSIKTRTVRIKSLFSR